MQSGLGATSVLIAEDELLISLDLCEALVEAGFQVIGPAITSVNALFLLQRHKPDLAIVDIQLRDGPCVGLTRQLQAMDVPFVICSGFPEHDSEPMEFRRARRIAKPALPRDIIEALSQLAAL